MAPSPEGGCLCSTHCPDQPSPLDRQDCKLTSSRLITIDPGLPMRSRARGATAQPAASMESWTCGTSIQRGPSTFPLRWGESLSPRRSLSLVASLSAARCLPSRTIAYHRIASHTIASHRIASFLFYSPSWPRVGSVQLSTVSFVESQYMLKKSTPPEAISSTRLAFVVVMKAVARYVALAQRWFVSLTCVMRACRSRQPSPWSKESCIAPPTHRVSRDAQVHWQAIHDA